MKVSVIIPVFNEEKDISECLKSLESQSFKDTEIIVVNDGSTDETLEIVKKFPVKYLTQNHLGPGKARNLGAKNATGDILVFVDGDMTFDKDFIKNLTEPIIDGKTIGTFSKEEYVLNKENIWSKCWNLNKDLPFNRMHTKDYPDEQPVFRAILKREFLNSGGFEPIGYIDDYTISKKLNKKAVFAPGAIFYHKNPQTLKEVFIQARWIGKSEYKNRKIKNENLMRIISIVRYSPFFSLINGIFKSFELNDFRFLIFKFIYDFGIEISLIRSYFKEQVNK